MKLTPQQAYEKAILEIRNQLFGVQGVHARMLRQMYAEFSLALLRIQVRTGNSLQEADLASLRRSIMREMQLLELRLNSIYDELLDEGLTGVSEAHRIAIIKAAETVGVSIERTFGKTPNFRNVPRRALEAMVARREIGLATTFKTLINRHIEALAPDVDRFLFDQLARGRSVAEATKDLAVIMARDNPNIKQVLKSLGPAGGRTLEAIKNGVEIPPDLLKKAKTLLSDAERISTTEMSTALFEGDVIASIESPMIDLLQWKTSGRHTEPDICDYYAQADLHGYGAGLYHKRSIPRKPHPRCQCYFDKVIKPVAEWGGPEKPLPDIIVPSREQFKRQMNRIARSAGRKKPLTSAYVDAQLASLDGLVSADRVARTFAPLATI